MADGPMISLAASVFESNYLLVFTLFDDFARNGGPFDKWAAMGNIVAIAVKKNICEYPFFSGFFVKEVHIDDITLSDAVLSSS